MTFLNFLLNVATFIAILANLPLIPFIKSLLPSPSPHILFPQEEEEDDSSTDPRGRVERDLIAVTYAAVLNEGQRDAKATMGLSFAKGYDVFGGGLSMGFEVPEESPQELVGAALLAIYHTLLFAPWSYDLYISTNSPLALDLVNHARQELKLTHPKGTTAWSPFLDPKVGEPHYAKTMRSILQAVWNRALKGNRVRIVGIEGMDVKEPKLFGEAKSLAESCLTDKAPQGEKESGWMCEAEDADSSSGNSMCSDCGLKKDKIKESKSNDVTPSSRPKKALPRRRRT